MVRFCLASLVWAATLVAESKIEVVRLDKTPYNERAIIHKMYTEKGIVGGKEAPLVLQVIDFPLGVNLPNKPEWLRGMRENGNGSTILLWVYGSGQFQKRFYLSKDDATPFTEDQTYFKDKFRKFFGSQDLVGLSSGKIVATAILVNACGESLKTFKATKTVVLDYLARSTDDQGMQQSTSKPHLVYNEPYGNFRVGQPVLLDFYVFNADIGRDAYRVDLYIDGKKEETLYEWAPYKLTNLSPGRHEVQLFLMDRSGNRLDEVFGEQKNTIMVGN